MDKLGNETHLMINTTKKYNKKQIGIHLESKRFFFITFRFNV